MCKRSADEEKMHDETDIMTLAEQQSCGCGGWVCCRILRADDVIKLIKIGKTFRMVMYNTC